jgi:ribonucleotide reductase alpha subunit
VAFVFVDKTRLGLIYYGLSNYCQAHETYIRGIVGFLLWCCHKQQKYEISETESCNNANMNIKNTMKSNYG